MKVNIWLAMSAQALTQFRNKRTAIRNETSYTGPMDDDTYRVLSYMRDADTVQRLFKSPSLGGKTYTLFSLYVEGSGKLKNAIDEIIAKWPAHVIVVGAWWMDGRQAGTRWVMQDATDADGNVTSEKTGATKGAPLYPLPAATWRVMPDTVTYDETGAETGRVSATSNAALKDINLLQGQSPRVFA